MSANVYGHLMAIALMSVAILGGIAIVFFFVIRWYRRTTSDERVALAALGDEHTMLHEYEPQQLAGHVLDLGFDVFEIGFGRRLVEQRLWSERTGESAFQLRGVGAGDNPGVKYSCGLVRLSRSAPDVVLTAQGVARQALQKLRSSSENLAIAGLDERFHVQTDDAAAARALLDDDVARWFNRNVEFLLAHHARVECQGLRLLVRLDHGSLERSMVALECGRQLRAIIDRSHTVDPL